jgi:hypothetical protein
VWRGVECVVLEYTVERAVNAARLTKDGFGRVDQAKLLRLGLRHLLSILTMQYKTISTTVLFNSTIKRALLSPFLFVIPS